MEDLKLISSLLKIRLRVLDAVVAFRLASYVSPSLVVIMDLILIV